MLIANADTYKILHPATTPLQQVDHLSLYRHASSPIVKTESVPETDFYYPDKKKGSVDRR